MFFTVTTARVKAWHATFVNLPRASSLTGTRRLQSLATTGAGPGWFRTNFRQSIGGVPVVPMARVPRDTLHRRIFAWFGRGRATSIEPLARLPLMHGKLGEATGGHAFMQTTTTIPILTLYCFRNVVAYSAVLPPQ